MNTGTKGEHSFFTRLALLPVLKEEAAPLGERGRLFACAIRIDTGGGANQTSAEEMKSYRKQRGAVRPRASGRTKGNQPTEASETRLIGLQTKFAADRWQIEGLGLAEFVQTGEGLAVAKKVI